MIEQALVAAAVGLSVPLAVAAHEATHAAVAALLGRNVRVRVRPQPTVTADYARARASWLVAVAPLLVGLVVAGLALARGTIPSGAALLVAIPWAIYTFGGGLQEYRFETGDGGA